MAKSAKKVEIYHWSGPQFNKEPDKEFFSAHLVSHTSIHAVWAFKIFETIGARATHAEDEDMQKYRALASTLGSGRITDNMITNYWFEGRELAVLYAALCNVQSMFLDKSRMNMEKTLMRKALIRPNNTEGVEALRCAIKSQASIMVMHTGTFLNVVHGALDTNERIQLHIE